MSGFFGYFTGGNKAEATVVVEEVDDPEKRERSERLVEKMAETIAPTVVAYRDISRAGKETLEALKSGRTFDAVMGTVGLFCWESYSAVAESHTVRERDRELGVEWYCSSSLGKSLYFRHGTEEPLITEVEPETEGNAVAQRNYEALGTLELPKEVGDFYLCVQKHCYTVEETAGASERDCGGHRENASDEEDTLSVRETVEENERHTVSESVRESVESEGKIEGECVNGEKGQLRYRVVSSGDYDEVAYREDFMICGLPHLFYMKEHVHRVLALLHDGGGYRCAFEASEALRESFRSSFPVVTQWCGQLLMFDDVELVQELLDSDAETDIRRLSARMPINQEFLKQHFARVATVLSGVTDLSISMMDRDCKKTLGVYRISNMVATFEAVLHHRNVVWTDTETQEVLRHDDGSLQTVDWDESEVFEAVVVVNTALKMFWMTPTIHFPETRWKMSLETLTNLQRDIHKDFFTAPFILDSQLKQRVLQAQKSAGGSLFSGASQLTISVTHIGHIPGEGLVSWVLPVEAFKRKILSSLQFRVCSLPHDDVPEDPFASVYNHPIANLWTSVYMEVPKLPSMLSGVMKIFASVQWIQNVLAIVTGLCGAIVTDFSNVASKLSSEVPEKS